VSRKAKSQQKSLLISLFAGPGCGKSTTMAGIFHELKCLDVNCEMGHEFAKEKVWEESYAVLRDQIYVFAKQLHTLRRLEGKVSVIVTDSPILLSLIYGKHEPQSFKDMVIDVHNEFNSINFLLRRRKKFNPAGRMHSLDQSKKIDKEIEAVLKKNGVAYETVDAGKAAVQLIVKRVMEELEAAKVSRKPKCQRN